MALADESNYGYVKQVALDWRESVRERRNMEQVTPTQSMLDQEQSLQRLAESQARGRGSAINAERRDSSFYRQSFSRGAKAVEIERNEGNMESDRIRVSEDVNLYLHQPVPITNEIRSSLQNAGSATSDTSLASVRIQEPVGKAK